MAQSLEARFSKTRWLESYVESAKGISLHVMCQPHRGRGHPFVAKIKGHTVKEVVSCAKGAGM